MACVLFRRAGPGWVDIDEPVVAADIEGGGCDGSVGAEGTVQAVSGDLEHVGAPYRLGSARRRRPRSGSRHGLSLPEELR